MKEFDFVLNQDLFEKINIRITLSFYLTKNNINHFKEKSLRYF